METSYFILSNARKAIRFIVVLLTSFFYRNSIASGGTIGYLGIEQGLSNNSVRSIFQDHNGFMWFGTYDGLNRYDGYQFKVFRNNLNDSSSLPHNYIYAINEDHHNNLWVGTGQGIGIYNNLTLKFSPAYFYPYKSRTKAKITFNINSIKTNTDGDVFIGSNGYGLFVQFEGEKVAVQIPLKKDKGEASDYNVQAISIDNKQRIWLFIRAVGLCLFNKNSRGIELVDNSVKSVQSIETDGENVWLGTITGLHKYSINTHSVTKIFTEATGKLTSNHVACLSFDKQKQLWIGTEGGGVNILNPVTEEVSYLLPGENKNTIASESVYAIHEDKESRKWIGTIKGGINIIDPFKKQFQTIAHDPLDRNSLINNFTSSFLEDNDKNLWIGSDGGGLSIWDRSKNKFTNFFHVATNPHSLSNNSVTSIKKDYLNNIWISTFGGGINKYNKATQSFEHYKCINDISGEENEQVWLIFEDRHRMLWVSTFGNGKLYRFDRQLNRFEVFSQELNDLIAITEDRNGVMWAGNSHQLIKIDKEDRNHVIYEIGKPIRSLYEDKAGNFWIGSEGGGLILFDRKKAAITERFSNADGLSNNSVLNILEDNKGYLWLSTFNGLSEFNPLNKTFKNFYQDDGLQSNQFLYNAALKLESGEFVFGGIKGFNIFYSDSILHIIICPLFY